MERTRFAVATSPHFDRLMKKLARTNPEVVDLFEDALGILSDDPYNRSGRFPIRKLEGVS